MKDNLIINAQKWAVKLGFSEEWLAKIAEFTPAAELVPFDPKNKVLFEKKDPKKALADLMTRTIKSEKFY